MHKQFLYAVLFCLCCSASQAQRSIPTTPLHYYLQKNFDTAIVINYYSAWSIAPNYQIISKLNGGMNAFTYRSPYPWYNGRAMPKGLADTFFKRKMAFDFTIPNANDFFLPYTLWRNISEKQLNKSLDSLQLWTMSDDTIDGYGCAGQSCAISDSGECDMWLITKGEIKKLYFYDPEFYEKCCPGRKGRQTFLTFLKLMNTIFH